MKLENIATEKIIIGIKKAFLNSESLLEEAHILQVNKKWARAYTFCQLAIEELAKIPLLFQFWIDRINTNKIDYAELNKKFKNHSEKTKLSTVFEIAFLKLHKMESGATWVDKIIKSLESFNAKLERLNDLKNESLYVSIKNNDFKSPDEIIDEETFNKIYVKALSRKMNFKNLMEKSEEYIYEIAKALKDEAKN